MCFLLVQSSALPHTRQLRLFAGLEVCYVGLSVDSLVAAHEATCFLYLTCRLPRHNWYDNVMFVLEEEHMCVICLLLHSIQVFFPLGPLENLSSLLFPFPCHLPP